MMYGLHTHTHTHTHRRILVLYRYIGSLDLKQPKVVEGNYNSRVLGEMHLGTAVK